MQNTGRNIFPRLNPRSALGITLVFLIFSPSRNLPEGSPLEIYPKEVLGQFQFNFILLDLACVENPNSSFAGENLHRGKVKKKYFLLTVD